jgi:hypothetical protein
MSFKLSVAASVLAASQVFAQSPSLTPSGALKVQENTKAGTAALMETGLPLSESNLESYITYYKVQEYYVDKIFKGSNRKEMLDTLATIISTADNPSQLESHEKAKSRYIELAQNANIRTHDASLLQAISSTPEGKKFLESLTPKTKGISMKQLSLGWK